MKRLPLSLALAALSLAGPAARACPKCRPFVNAGVYGSHFAGHLGVVLLPVLVLLGLAFALWFVDAPRKARG